MPTYVAITDAEVAPEAPVTTSLMTRLRDNALAFLGAPSGTKALFVQSAAPFAWTKDVDQNDKALRIVSGTPGTGGSVAFSTLFARTATDSFTIAQANLPSVNFTHSGTTLSTASDINLVEGVGTLTAAQVAAGATSHGVLGTAVGTSVVLNNDGQTVTAQGSAASGGSGTALAAGIDMRVQYVDVIKATKD